MNTVCDVRCAARPGASLAPLHVLRADECPRVPVDGGAGWETTILSGEGGAAPAMHLVQWELSGDAVLPAESHRDRLLVLLAGQQLQVNDGYVHRLQVPLGMARCAGDRPLQVLLPDGPCRVLDVTWPHGQCDVQCWQRSLAGSMVLFSAIRESWLVFLLEGAITLDTGKGEQTLAPGDGVILMGGSAGHIQRHVLHGSGSVLLLWCKHYGMA